MNETVNTSRTLADEEYERGAAYHKAYNKQAPVPENVRFYFYVINGITIQGMLCLFGVFANIVNIVVFYRQGPMSSSPTVILTGLAVSDLVVCIMGLIGVAFKIMERSGALILFGWYVQNLMIVVAARPAFLLTQVTCLFTTFMSLERAVSVAFPFKVKTIFAPRRSLAILVVTFIVLSVITIPRLSEYKGTWVRHAMHPDRFRIVVPTHIFSKTLHEVYFIVGPIFLRFSSVFVVVFCNIIIFWKVKSSQRFRKSKASTTDAAALHTHEDTQIGKTKETTATTTTTKGNNPSSKDIKDLKLLRMITVVAGVFVACYSFDIVNTIVLELVFKVYIDYHPTLSNMVSDAIRTIQYFNSFINAVIYFKMSARYKEELLIWLGRKTR